jgi:hypothetical protein
MAAGGLAANERFFKDLIGALKARGARLDALWSWQVRNELAFDSDQPPLSLASGVVTAANGLTYDMAVPAHKKRIQDESLAFYLDRTRAAIRSVDPSALVAVGFFVPQEPNPARPGDPRVIDPRPSYASTMDFVDLHAYPGLDLTLEQLAENYGIAEIPSTKPVIFGEMGAFRGFAYPTVAVAIDGIAGWQVRSCALGVDGWLTWTWNLVDPVIWTATEAGGGIRKALSPAVRPNPCDWGPVARDVAYNADTSASGSLGGDLPSHAVDGDNFTKWNSGGGAPQWLQVDLGGNTTLTEVHLHVSRFPASGSATHEVYGRVGSTWWLITTHSGAEEEGDWVVLTPVPPLGGPWTGISAIRVETTASDSWVAWWDVKLIGTPE